MIALVRRSQPSRSWLSCAKISVNLEKAHLLAAEEDRQPLRVFEFDPQSGWGSARTLMKELLGLKPDRIVLIEHQEHAPEFLSAWLEAGGSAEVPIFVHCYGDFPLEAARWERLSHRLRGRPVRLICASAASAGSVGELLAPGAEPPVVAPFPVEASIFRPQPARGRDFRERHGILAEDFVVLSSGRISLQKNVSVLIEALRRFSCESSRRVVLLVAGEFDDIGVDPFGVQLAPLEYFRAIRGALADPGSEGERFRSIFLGHREPGFLSVACNAADLFMSLSLHHDEDFGLAPAEALCAGTPAVLSAWGGFHDFHHVISRAGFPQAVRLVQAVEKRESVEFRWPELLAALREAECESRGSSGAQARAELGAAASQDYSIEACARKFARILRDKPGVFSGFGPAAGQLGRLLRTPGWSAVERFGEPFYRRFYRHYFAPFRTRRG